MGAQEQGWGQVSGATKIYRLEDEATGKSLDMVLLCRGEPMWGYDTHSGQRKNHDNLMAQLGDAVLAFQNDLTQNGHADRVLLCTTSEFGRRVKENGSQGTDHGAAAASFLFGPGLKPGIHGKHPSLTDLQGGGGGSLKHTTDFRSLYATMLEKWLGIPSEPVLGKKYPLVDCVG